MFLRSFFLAFLLDNKKYLYNISIEGRKKNIITQRMSIINSENGPIVNDLITNLWKRSSDGRDHRFNATEEIDNELIAKIAKNNYKMNLLKTLINKELSNDIKILYINDYERLNKPKIETPNLKAGGLFKDWDNI